MGFFDRFRGRDPTLKNEAAPAKPTETSRISMVTTWGEYYYAWNGKLYQSDIIGVIYCIFL